MHSFDYDKLAEKTWDTDMLNLIAKIHECKGRQELEGVHFTFVRTANDFILREYEEALEINEETAKELAHATKGYAFAFQALGALYFENRDKLSTDKIIKKLDGLLDEYVYRKIWEVLTAQEKKFLLAMDDENSFTSSEICKISGIKNSSVAKYREHLINIGLIHSPEY